MESDRKSSRFCDYEPIITVLPSLLVSVPHVLGAKQETQETI